eukprot:434253_1
MNEEIIEEVKESDPESQEQLKLLFLDVDGVLNAEKKSKQKTYDVSEAMIKRLAAIVETTNCKICLSTSWRMIPSAKQALFLILKQIGGIDMMDEVHLGDTPRIYDKPRALEIAQFLNALKCNVTAWCALDDGPLHRPPHEKRQHILKQCQSVMENHFVQTDASIGLTDENVKQVISILQQ